MSNNRGQATTACPFLRVMLPFLRPLNRLTIRQSNALAITAGIVLAATALSHTKNQYLKTVIEIGGSHFSGARVQLEHFSLDLLRQRIELRQLTVGQPNTFQGNPLATISTVLIDFDLGRTLKGDAYFTQAVLDLEEVVLIRNTTGELNVETLPFNQKEEKLKEEHKNVPVEEKKPAQGFHIQELKLRINRIVYWDQSSEKQTPPKVYENVLKQKSYHDITSVYQLTALVLAHSMQAAAIKRSGIYAAAALSGVGFIPVTAIGVLASDDASSVMYNGRSSRALHAIKDFLDQRGTVKRTNEETGELWAKVDGFNIYVKLNEEDGGTRITLAARRFFLAKPEIAAGLLYEFRRDL